MKVDIQNLHPKKILIRSTNWIGDAIMTTPAVRTIRENFPNAEISILVQPWVADVFSASPHIDNIVYYHKRSDHKGITGMWKLSRTLADKNFDMAILLQNAFEAALISFMAGIPNRAGYIRDCRKMLLTHPISIPPKRRKIHQVNYYQDLLSDLGLKKGSDDLFLQIEEKDRVWAAAFLKEQRPKGPVIGLNPGAAYGPAKRWPAQMYGELASLLVKKCKASIVVFGTKADNKAADTIQHACGEKTIDLTGKTSLSKAMAIIEKCNAFVTNDSGLMHVGAALKTPLVAIFGSTDSIATGPFSQNAIVVQKKLDCSPCLKTHCDKNFECMSSLSVEEVKAKVEMLLG